ncbi:MAG: GTP pyrophosphokinase family protein [Roseburia sp.]
MAEKESVKVEEKSEITEMKKALRKPPRRQAEKKMREKLERPMVSLRYACAIDVLMARLRLINADLSEQKGRVLIRNMSSRIKTTDSIIKKLERKKRDVTFENAVNTLNDIAGIRAVCYFCDDIYQVADALRRQSDITVLKEKDYVKNPKKSGYQSIHLIVSVPVTYLNRTDDIRVEVQIRSFAMDYWAELDNQMCYKKSAGQIENVGRETRNYSDVIAGVDNQMLELRKKIEKMQEEAL